MHEKKELYILCISTVLVLMLCFSACTNTLKKGTVQVVSEISESRLFPTIKVPTKSLVIVDLVKDKIEGQVAACALQGIVNRNSEEKIYVMNTLCNDNYGAWFHSKEKRSPQAQMGEFWLKELFADIPLYRLEVNTIMV